MHKTKVHQTSEEGCNTELSIGNIMQATYILLNFLVTTFKKKNNASNFISPNISKILSCQCDQIFKIIDILYSFFHSKSSKSSV